MAGNPSVRLTQLVAIAAARTRRAADAMQVCQRAVETCNAALAKVEAAVAVADIESHAAKVDQLANPVSEQHRLWATHCTALYQSHCADRDQAQAELADADAELTEATRFWNRQQLRQEHMENHAATVQRAINRTLERRSEDDAQGGASARAVRI